MSHLPYFNFYPADFLASENVSTMTLEEIGAYTLLLCHSWLNGSIPSDTAKMARLCRVTPEKMATLWESLRHCYSVANGTADRLINPRQEEDRKKLLAAIEKRADAGRKGAENRWGKGKAKNGNAIDLPLPPQCHSDPDPDKEITYPTGKAQSAKPQEEENLDGEPSQLEPAAVKHPIWGDALELLVSSGEKPSSARAFLGRALKQYGDGALEEAISSCIVESPVEPKAFLMACLKKFPRRTGVKPRTGGTAVPSTAIVSQNDRRGGSGKL
jgi:uncharacterized protein YdaU (DUF1376 family)